MEITKSLSLNGGINMRTITFAKRNLKELSRDVLGYIFCIAFPIVMLIIMSVVNESIPAEAHMTTFRIDNLSGGIILFGQTFVMLFTAILVSTDKNTSFLTRTFRNSSVIDKVID